jgi:cyclic-di-AMP phosphodiesterase PgpH
MSLFDRAVRAPLRAALLRLAAWLEGRPASSSPAAHRESLLQRDVRVPAKFVGAALWAMLVVVLYQELGPGWDKAAAIALLTGVVAALFIVYLRRDHQDLMHDEEAVSLLGVLLIVTVWLMELWVEVSRMYPRLSPLGMPVAAAPILVALLLSARLAVMVGVALGVLYGVINGFSFDETVVKLLGSVAGVAAALRIRARGDILRAGMWVGAVQALAVASLALLRGWPAGPTAEGFAWAFFSALLSVLIVGAVLPTLESFFSRLTPMRLLELSDVNHPLLRRMSLEAPGTYHHSLIMASLASAAAETVGANALLCRVGAYFHDIGKMVKPEYFVENQGALGNPHDPLPPSMSRLVIQSHVKEGLALARQHGLDKAVADFIGTHHGTSRIEYFYRRALERTEELDQVDEDDYRYPGPKPYSRETAILMLADGVEASVRALAEPTPQRIRDQIRKIVDQKLSDGQFDEVPLTLQDISRISDSFFNTLAGVYHNRIQYPGQDAPVA